MKTEKLIQGCVDNHTPVLVLGGDVNKLKTFGKGVIATLKPRDRDMIVFENDPVATLVFEEMSIDLCKQDLNRMFVDYLFDTLIVEKIEDFKYYCEFMVRLTSQLNFYELKERHFIFTAEKPDDLNRAFYDRIAIVREEEQEIEIM